MVAQPRGGTVEVERIGKAYICYFEGVDNGLGMWYENKREVIVESKSI